MASTFGEEKSVDTHFCQWLVSISLHSTFEGNISTKINGFKSYHVRLPDLIFISCWTTKQRYGFSNRVKRTFEASSGTRREFGFSS